MKDMDMTGFQKGATYAQIKEYLQEFRSMEHFKQKNIEYLDYYNKHRGKAKGLTACNAQTTSPFGRLNKLRSIICLSNFSGTLQNRILLLRRKGRAPPAQRFDAGRGASGKEWPVKRVLFFENGQKRLLTNEQTVGIVKRDSLEITRRRKAGLNGEEAGEQIRRRGRKARKKGESDMTDMIRIEHLQKRFGDVHAVNDLSFRVKRGELFAFLGVNGAGKSTTINILCGQLKKDSGSVAICGTDLDREPDAIKRKLGVVFQNSVLDKELSVRDNLESRAALYGIHGAAFKKRLLELSELLDFSNLLRRSVGKLSGGQRRRIDIARALLHEPEILILDEPTTGLDPQTRSLLWQVVARLRREKNLTVFLTTHYMEEAADADYVVILEKGKIAAEGTPLTLKNTYTGDFITLYGVEEAAVKALGAPYEAIRDAFRVSVPDTAAATKLIVEHPALFSDYEITKGKMDDVFLAVTGRVLTGGEQK